MFWRKKSEGFEWQEYVRTTILLRRKDRHNKLEAAKQAAVDGLKDAGRRSVEAGAVGAKAAGSSLWSGGLWLASAPVKALSAAWMVGSPLLAAVRERMAVHLAPAASLLNRPLVFRALIAVAVLAGVAALARTLQFGFDGDAQIAASLAGIAAGLICLARIFDPNRTPSAGRFSAALQRAAQSVTDLRQSLPVPSLNTGTLAIGAACVFAAGMIWLALPALPRLAQTLTSTAAPAATISGTVTVVSAHTLRVAGSLIQLAGVETPDENQTCLRDGQKPWRCGAAAKAALERLARGRKAECVGTPGGGDAGATETTCTVNGKDIGAELVRTGFAFSSPGLLSSSYAAEEDEAKGAKAGLWAGTAERAADWRARIWNEASRAAPGGCPIKGRVTSGSRVYVLPWSSGYSKVTVREARGERWFCSEDEARTSGWSPVERS